VSKNRQKPWDTKQSIPFNKQDSKPIQKHTPKNISSNLTAPKGFIPLMLKLESAEKIQSGYPLLMKMDVQNGRLPEKEEGQKLWLTAPNGQYIGTAYFGVQNKGIGWVISRNKDAQFTVGFFVDLLRRAMEARKDLPSPVTTAYRFFNGEGDGFGGLTIDYYAGNYVFTWYSTGAYVFSDLILKAFESLVPDYISLYFKRRFETGGQYKSDKDFIKGVEAQGPIVIKENNISYCIYLDDGPMVGIFLDQRDVRLAIRKRYSKGQQVLNTFSYTGAFSVAAHAGGAQETVSVDLANRSLQKTSEQFEINGFDLSTNQIVVEDVFNYFKYAAKKQLLFDTVILDPPSYAKSKQFIFAAEKNYVGLLEDAIALTKIGGVIVASTNCSSFDMRAFHQMVTTAFQNTHYRFQVLESYKLPSDYKTLSTFPEGNYLKVLFIEKGPEVKHKKAKDKK
jgi:23S rRNA (cytosine1962-C5)-methyltransferase